MPKRGSKRASADGGPAAKAPKAQPPRYAPAPHLECLPEEMTLKIFGELDFRSLGAVQQTSRHLNRLARDKSLFRRISMLRWDEFYCSPRGVIRKKVLRTNCERLGVIRLPDGDAERAAKFMLVLKKLLEGGAALISLETPSQGGELPNGLLALLAKHSVRLKALSHWGNRDGLMEMLHSQPELQHLFIGNLPQGGMAELVEALPSLRHLDLGSACDLDEDLWQEPDYARGLGKLVGKLRSLVVYKLWGDHWRGPLEVLGEASGGKLLFRGTTSVADARPIYDPLDMCTMYFAVEDFRREERGGLFFHSDPTSYWAPRDAWDDLRHHVAEPTLDPARVIQFFIDHLKLIIEVMHLLAENPEEYGEEEEEEESLWDEDEDADDFTDEEETSEDSAHEEGYDAEADALADE